MDVTIVIRARDVPAVGAMTMFKINRSDKLSGEVFGWITIGFIFCISHFNFNSKINNAEQ